MNCYVIDCWYIAFIFLSVVIIFLLKRTTGNNNNNNQTPPTPSTTTTPNPHSTPNTPPSATDRQTDPSESHDRSGSYTDLQNLFQQAEQEPQSSSHNKDRDTETDTSKSIVSTSHPMATPDHWANPSQIDNILDTNTMNSQWLSVFSDPNLLGILGHSHSHNPSGIDMTSFSDPFMSSTVSKKTESHGLADNLSSLHHATSSSTTSSSTTTSKRVVTTTRTTSYKSSNPFRLASHDDDDDSGDIVTTYRIKSKEEDDVDEFNNPSHLLTSSRYNDNLLSSSSGKSVEQHGESEDPATRGINFPSIGGDQQNYSSFPFSSYLHSLLPNKSFRRTPDTNPTANYEHPFVYKPFDLHDNNNNNNNNNHMNISANTPTNPNETMQEEEEPFYEELEEQRNFRFTLKNQPNPVQRKCYRTENRYLLPNPIIISPRGWTTRSSRSPVRNSESEEKGSPKTSKKRKSKRSSKEEEKEDEGRELDPSEVVTSGTITISIVDGNSRQPKEGDVLESIGGFQQTITKRNPTTKWTLKVLANSGPSGYRLKFDVNYTTADGRTHEESVLSNFFKVLSNKSFVIKDYPQLYDIMPKSGSNLSDTEIWIKGSEFNKRGVRVTFGGHDGRVTEIAPNLLTVVAPRRPDIKEDKTVVVEVFNQYMDGDAAAGTKLSFHYFASKGRSLKTRFKNEINL